MNGEVFLGQAGKILSKLYSGSVTMTDNISYNSVKICHSTDSWSNHDITDCFNFKNQIFDPDAAKTEVYTVGQGSATYSLHYDVIQPNNGGGGVF
jgi:hypothetical protein